MIPGDTSSFFPVESLFRNIDVDDNRPPPAAATIPHDFHGGTLMMRRSMSFSGVDLSSSDHHHHNHQDQEMNMDDEFSEDGGALGEKKKRLSMEQVKALEKSFEVGSKLEPERKTRLAKALGLQPKQVAIWFQNRRARGKTKQMEKEYEHLKKQLELLKADNEILRAQNEHYHSELMALQSRESGGMGAINLNKENEAGSWSNASDSSADVNPNAPPHFLHGSVGGTDHRHHQEQPSSDGGLSNMFTSVQEQPSFWPWPDHPNFR